MYYTINMVTIVSNFLCRKITPSDSTITFVAFTSVNLFARFSYKFVNPERLVFGFPTRNGKFPGLFGDLALRVSDIKIHPLFNFMDQK